jgi:HAD superfamily hydrolase (TIGR01509 family)
MRHLIELKRVRPVEPEPAPAAAVDVRLVIFDFDGVVVDSEAIACRVLAAALSRHGFPADVSLVVDRYLGRAFSVVRNDYAAALGRPMPDEFASGYRRDLEAAFRAELRPMAGVAAALDHLAARGLPFAIASSSSQGRIAQALSVTALAGRFGDRIFDAAMVERGKPAPDLFLHVARRMGAAPAQSLVIEDSPAGVQAGKAAGMTVWGFTGGAHHASFDGDAALQAAGADRLITSMVDLLVL